MDIRRRVAAVATTVTLVAGAAVFAPTAMATGDPNRLDRGDFTTACRQQYNQAGYVANNYGGAFGWKCVNYWGLGSSRLGIDLNSYCRNVLGMGSAAYRDANDPYSWYCRP